MSYSRPYLKIIYKNNCWEVSKHVMLLFKKNKLKIKNRSSAIAQTLEQFSSKRLSNKNLN